MMETLENLIEEGLVGKTFSADGKSFTIQKADNFEYVDPIDASISKKQVSFLAGSALEG